MPGGEDDGGRVPGVGDRERVGPGGVGIELDAAHVAGDERRPRRVRHRLGATCAVGGDVRQNGDGLRPSAHALLAHDDRHGAAREVERRELLPHAVHPGPRAAAADQRHRIDVAHRHPQGRVAVARPRFDREQELPGLVAALHEAGDLEPSGVVGRRPHHLVGEHAPLRHRGPEVAPVLPPRHVPFDAEHEPAAWCGGPDHEVVARCVAQREALVGEGDVDGADPPRPPPTAASASVPASSRPSTTRTHRRMQRSCPPLPRARRRRSEGGAF